MGDSSFALSGNVGVLVWLLRGSTGGTGLREIVELRRDGIVAEAVVPVELGVRDVGGMAEGGTFDCCACSCC